MYNSPFHVRVYNNYGQPRQKYKVSEIIFYLFFIGL